MAGSELGLGIDLALLPESGWPLDSMRWPMALVIFKRHVTVTLSLLMHFSTEWEESVLHRSIAYSTMEAHKSVVGWTVPAP